MLVETLPSAAYHHAHLPGAINLPPNQVTQLAPTLLPDKTADIVVYCAKPT
jgi:rhodanese-related sulfurtransferase